MDAKKLAIVMSSITIVISIATICLEIFVFAKDKPDKNTEYQQMIKENYQVFSAPIPDKITFCGEEVPINNTFVRESLDRELTYLTYQHASTFIILKRSFRYFPQIEKILKSQNMPLDLKYLCVVESSLNNVVSSAKAEGFWQFIPSAGKENGLTINDEYDERYSIEKSTIAACKYLRGSKSRLGSWSLACAAYNCGEGGIKARIREQGINSYWDLALNSETARYVYRIIAYKILMQNPKQYGFYIRKQDLYQPLDYDTIHIDSTITDFYAFSKKINVPYKYFRLFNPELQAKKLSNKENKIYIIKIPTKDDYDWEKLVGRLENRYEFL